MPILVTDKYKLEVEIPHQSAHLVERLSIYSNQIDTAIDTLISKSKDDHNVRHLLNSDKHEELALIQMSRLLKSSTSHAPWLRPWFGTTICRTALKAINSKTDYTDTCTI